MKCGIKDCQNEATHVRIHSYKEDGYEYETDFPSCDEAHEKELNA